MCCAVFRSRRFGRPHGSHRDSFYRQHHHIGVGCGPGSHRPLQGHMHILLRSHHWGKVRAPILEKNTQIANKTFTFCFSWQCPKMLPPQPWQGSTPGLSTLSLWQREEDGNKAMLLRLTPSQVQRTVRFLLLEEAFLWSCFIVSRILTAYSTPTPLLFSLQQIAILFLVSAQWCGVHLIQSIRKKS